MALTVTQPFADHAVGDVITHDKDIADILASEQAAFVVQIPAPPVKAPAVPPAD